MPLPDQRYINYVRDALWSRAGRASVMIGSGFSKNALPNRPDVGELPIWGELAREMSQKLGLPSGGGDAIVLAQQYADAFGRSGLHQFLQQRVRDREFSPGGFHRRLMKLPWSDVFTTNWDTLLERTLPSVPERPYSIVHNKDEIPIANHPRIVKLHGSLDGHYPLIATQQDYDSYPSRHAPFVNTVQQAMMETVFVLVGFSGNDPNFINWSSWVNENLGGAAPRVFLAGWLGFSAEERKRLRCRNVTAIDLARHPKAMQWPDHLRYRYAVDWILSSLERGRSYDVANWPTLPTRSLPELPSYLQPVEVVDSDSPKDEPWSPRRPGDPESKEASVRHILEIWRHNREIYPGWLIAPLEVRSSRIAITRQWEPDILQVLSSLPAVDRLNTIHELVWRHEITLEPLSSQLESATLDTLALIDCEARTVDGVARPRFDWSAVREAYRYVALSLVTAARHRLDESAFSQRINTVEQFLGDDPDVGHRISHERCLWVAWALDFEALDDLLSHWNTENSDPIWMLRKAALQNEAGQDDEANELIGVAMADIRRFPVDDRSVAGPSREGWGLWSTVDFENEREILNRWSELASRKCNAYAEKTEVANALSAKTASGDPPDFDLEIARTSTSRLGTARRSATPYRAVRLSEVGALSPASPTAFPFRAAASSMLRLAAEQLVMSNPELAVRLVLRSCTYDEDETLKRVLSRTRVALLQDDAVPRLVADCLRMVDHSLAKGWAERLRVALEVLSRLVLRLGSDAALEIFDYTLKLYGNRQYQVMAHPWISPPLQNLLKRTWQSLTQDQRMLRAPALLGAPIIGSDGFTAQVEDLYPEPGGLLGRDSRRRLLVRSNDNAAQWQDAVSLITRALRAGEEARRRATERLLSLTVDGFLTEVEGSRVANALWDPDYRPDDGLPGATFLYDWAFLTLPEPSPSIAERRFRAKWLSTRNVLSRLDAIKTGVTTTVTFRDSPSDPSRLEDTLWNVGLAIDGMERHGRSLTLSDAERRYLVSLISQWADVPVPAYPLDPIGELKRYTNWAVQALAPILSRVEIPEPFGDRLFEKLKSLTDSGIPAYEPVGELVRVLPQRAAGLSHWLRTALASSNRDIATGGLRGLESWLYGPGSSADNLPNDLLHELGLIIAARRRESLSEALRIAKQVFDKGTDEHQGTIINSTLQGLVYLAEELSYDDEHGAGDVPHLRWRCVQLASSMSEAGFDRRQEVMRWLELGSTDPFPEIRHVTTGNQTGTLLESELDGQAVDEGEVSKDPLPT